MTTVTWRGQNGSWTSGLSWQSLQAPGSLDTAWFTTDSSTAELSGFVSVADVAFGPGSATTLLLQGSLAMTGTLALTAGTLDLASGGTIEGGTVDLAGGAFIGAGGVADGVVWLGALGDGLAITAATAAATQAAGQTLDVAGALTLEGGSYAAAHFVASTYLGASEQLDADVGGTVTLASTATLFASADDPNHDAQTLPSFSGLTLGGAGSFVNDGLVVSDLASAYVPLTIDAAGFVNAGVLALDTATVPDQQQTFTIQQGHIPQTVTLTFDESFTPGLLESAAAFVNTGTILGEAASIDVTGASFANAGSILLGAALVSIPVVTTTAASVGTIAVDSTLDIAASVGSFSNTGTISAGVIRFDDNLTLAQLGAVTGDILFTGTFDLGGGTLDVGQLDPSGSFTFTGTVLNGTLIADGGTLVTTGASLEGVTVLAQAPGVLLNVASGSVVLGATTTELAYTTAASIAQLGVVAGAPGVTDLIGARAPGTLSFGAATTIADTVAGSTMEIGGAGTFSDSGKIALAGSTLGIATLDGDGTITVADGAVLQIGELAATAAPTLVFGAGHNLLALPADDSGANALGLTLDDLQSGDVIDFAGVSSDPPAGTFGDPGAEVQNGTLDVQGASGDQASVAMGGSAAGLTFTVTSDPTGGTLVTVSCFRRGTRIATPDGEVPVERLRIGDRVLTAGGGVRPVKWLGRRSYSRALVAEQRQLRPVRFAVGALGHGLPRRPLYLSPLHGVLLAAPDGRRVLVPAAALVNGRGISRARIAAVSYLHVEVDTPDAVLAEGAAAESFVDCDSRCLFENADEFAWLYPGHRAAPWAYYAPRIEEGAVLEAIRASLPGQPAPSARTPSLRWHIDRQADGRIEGWICDCADPATPVEFEVFADHARLARAVANRYRVDLDQAGLRQGACAFSLQFPDIDAATLASAQLRTLTGLVLDR
jgi:hypothetical protein